MPAACTSTVVPDPFVALAAGRTPFRVADLLALVALIRRWQGAERVNENVPHM